MASDSNIVARFRDHYIIEEKGKFKIVKIKKDGSTIKSKEL